MNLTRRIGNFFLTIGLTLLALFFFSDIIKDPQAWYLFLGTALLGLGIFLAVRTRSQPQESQRFRLVRRLFGRKKEDKRDRESDEEDGDEDDRD